MGKRKLALSSTRDITFYAYLNSAAQWALEQAEGTEEGRFYNCMSSIMLSAFCIEAYLNYIGSEIIPYWDEDVKQNINTPNKLKILCHHLNLAPDFSRRPFQSFKHITKYRNIIAHGTSVKISDQSTQTVRDGEKVKYPKTWWEEQSNLIFAKRWLADTESIIIAIHEAAGKGSIPFGILEIATQFSTVK
ncbi:hypothetical protein ACFLVW_02270 [Chloroflexota bacterium]